MNKIFMIILLLVGLYNFNIAEESIKIEPPLFNFGTVSPGKIISTYLTVYNQSNNELNINLHTTCGCMVAGEKKILLSPEESKKVRIKLNTSGYDGYIVKEIIITSDNSDDSPLFFKMQGNVERSIINKIISPMEKKNVIYTNNFHNDMTDNPQIVIFFAYKNCKECDKILFILNKWTLNKNDNINIHYYQLEDVKNKKNIYELSKKHGYYPELPLVIHKNVFYSGVKNIENIFLKNKIHIEKSNKKIISKLNPSAIFFSGLIDAINPCAFTIIILLLSYLAIRFKNRIQILLSGVIYIFSVFLTCFLLGIGLFDTFRMTQVFKIISIALKYGLTLFLLILAFISLHDYIKVKKNKSSEMTIKLPLFLKSSIRKNKNYQVNYYSILIRSVILGFTFSLFELLCNEQLYFPIIGYMVRTESERFLGTTLLLLYNFGFIIPLTAVFTAFYFGISSKFIGNFFNKHLSLVKLLFAGLFAAFAFVNFIF
ncbi:MAG: DUF1573 domain-containing protein [Spirochaetes bacterium]|nr:DUF1573 domain-containing protein [Spirochaetota bacterium]